jgi:hypothetical protein
VEAEGGGRARRASLLQREDGTVEHDVGGGGGGRHEGYALVPRDCRLDPRVSPGRVARASKVQRLAV